MAKLPAPPNCASFKRSNLPANSSLPQMLYTPVLAPGCKQFGIQAFEECWSLIQIGANGDTTNQLAPQAELMPRAFEKCTALRRLDLGRLPLYGIGKAVCSRQRHV